MSKSALSRMKGRLFFWFKRFCLTVLLIWGAGIVLFSFLPVPFSAVMVQKAVWCLANREFFLCCPP
ncbi:Uncharacterised protein [Budvicia aquatica]|uniref:Monofunctional biosynthetic peptidoglycan transglycosylase n=1 Tax=Budvicia aquatica TaxID=82979 RepID=A0A484ZCV2_9GAMM|nr:Uncharacterised protein [Budvicia aquatica]